MGLLFDGRDALAVDIADTEAEARRGAGKIIDGAAWATHLLPLLTAEATARGQADTTLGERITAEAMARASADMALGVRIDALVPTLADPVFDPAYWLKTNDARTIIVHLDPTAITDAVAKIRLDMQGVPVTVDKVANQDVYAFAFNAANSATISRAAGNAGSDTVRATVELLDSGDAVSRRWLSVLRVLDEAPDTGGGGGGGGIPEWTEIATITIDSAGKNLPFFNQHNDYLALIDGTYSEGRLLTTIPHTRSGQNVIIDTVFDPSLAVAGEVNYISGPVNYISPVTGMAEGVAFHLALLWNTSTNAGPFYFHAIYQMGNSQTNIRNDLQAGRSSTLYGR